MANIKQQRKRVKTAARQRLENIKYKSRIKTMFKSLTVAAQEDKERASQLGLELISLIDKAASRGVIHPNNGARKKSQVTAIVELPAGTGRPAGPATKESREGKSKKDRRAERLSVRAGKEDAVKEKHKAKAAAEAKAAKAKPKKEEAAAEPAAEEAPAAEEVPAEEIPAEEAPAEEAPAAEEVPAEEIPVEEAPAAETPVEEAPAEEAPAEEAPAEEAPAEEAPAEETTE